MAEGRRILGDLFEPKPWIYWTDFLVTWLIGNVGFVLTRLTFEKTDWPLHIKLLAAIVPFVISGLAFYRAAMFIHELIHFRAGTMNSFRFAWNLLCGIPFLIPSFVYYPHIEHHRRKHYGTEHDGEYLPLGRQGPWHIFYYLSQSLVIPILGFVRFFIFTPLAWIIPGFRRWVHQRASSMVMDPSYIRPLPTAKTLRIIWLQEALCFAWLASLFVSAWMVHHRLPWPFLLQAYCLGVFIVTLNALRTLGAHRWSNHGEEMTFVEQLLDTVNYPHRPWITEIWGPTGTRMHALHHLYPSLPYHSLPEAHRRLMRELPADSPYRQTECGSLTEALLNLWRRARQAAQQEQAPTAEAAQAN